MVNRWGQIWNEKSHKSHQRTILTIFKNLGVPSFPEISSFQCAKTLNFPSPKFQNRNYPSFSPSFSRFLLISCHPCPDCTHSTIQVSDPSKSPPRWPAEILSFQKKNLAGEDCSHQESGIEADGRKRYREGTKKDDLTLVSLGDFI